jgi:hypothetical protein
VLVSAAAWPGAGLAAERLTEPGGEELEVAFLDKAITVGTADEP